ncbi:lamin tail domain-containing protein [bacterium]|nr:lamin tail domain-containing protein [candidate division CSSED10-310 bacterium]
MPHTGLPIFKNLPGARLLMCLFFCLPAASGGMTDPIESDATFRLLRNDIHREILLELDTESTIPPLPVISRLIQISPDTEMSVELELERIRRTTVNHLIPDLKGDPVRELEWIPEVAGPGMTDPGFRISLGSRQIFRSIHVARLTVLPYLWDPATGEILVLEKARIRIFADESPDRPVPLKLPPITHSFDTLYRAAVINYQPKLTDEFGEPEYYLIVTPDEYESRLQGFIAWKEEEGYRVDLLRMSALPSAPTPAQLRQAILNYFYGPHPPVYVLICGDQYTTPLYYSYDTTHPGDYVDDLYYSLLAGEDILPDVFLGRLPVKNGLELTIMLSKILEYELAPRLENPAFYTTALMAASSLEQSQIDTKEQTRERLETYCGYETVHTFYEWNAFTVDNLIATIDQGVSIINYRGEGWRRGWNPDHEYWFDYDDVYTLHNAHMTPFVTSIGCGVNMFADLDDCWGHAMMAHGSVSVPLGSVGIVGPTWNTHTTYNNWLDRGFYRGYVYWNTYRVGQAMNYGKMYMWDNFPDPGHDAFIDVHFRTYLVFGTPDMWIRTGLPLQSIAGLGYDNDSMDRYVVARNELGSLIDAATISWAANGIRRVYPVDESGGVPIDLTQVPSNSVRVVIAGKNLIPVDVDLPWNSGGTTGSMLITEIKPDIPTENGEGDMVELYNLDTSPIDLNGWTLSDLDGYDTPFVDMPALLQPQQIAVIVFAGPRYDEEIIPMPYGLKIISREIPDFSSLEDIVVLRDPLGRIVDCLAWHDQTGTGSTNVAGDLSRLTAPTTPFEILPGGWWDGPDAIDQSTYENFTVNWSPFAGNGGEGSIHRAWTGSPDGSGNFTVQSEPGFGSYQHSGGEETAVRSQ